MRSTLQLLFSELKARFGDRPRQNEPLAKHTTFRVGGPADIWLAVETLEELIATVKLARQHNVPVFMLGGGANLLVTDAGIRGLVIENRCTKVTFPDESSGIGETVTLTVESGVVLPNLARRCVKRGLSGLEWAAGVPGTIGGAIVNNAGAYDGDMARNLQQAALLSPAGDQAWYPVDWFDYSYRTSRLKHTHNESWVVLEAALTMSVTDDKQAEEKLRAFNEKRKASQPPGATIGSMFKNPPGDYAGRLIEAAGLKGYQIGAAQISPIHANFFQNLGEATATEVLTLIKTAQKRVLDQFGIKLQLEVEVIGDTSR
ncbi:MAG: UDP-N-acetylmuramate dehydrogenase [Chloroflexota bacterium]